MNRQEARGKRQGMTLAQVALALVLAAFAPVTVYAQVLPDARAVLNRYAEAVGGKALEAAPGITMRGRVDIPAAGLSGTVESFTGKSGRAMQVVVLEGIGEMKQGTDSTFGWSLDPVSGARILTDKEYADRRDSESVAGMLRRPAMVSEAKTLARTTIDGKACVQVQLKWKSGRESTECYSEETGLLVSVSSVQSTQMGDVPYTSSIAEYMKVGDVTLPKRVVQRLAANEFTITFSEIMFGAIDPAKLVLPSEIQALRR
jgi:hypothetical protein